MAIQIKLGVFSLAFAPGGKLEWLSPPEGPNLLYEGQVAFDISGGLTYRIAGWDEIYPTIEPHGETPIMGRLVRFAPTLEREDRAVHQTWVAKDFRARRTFRSLEANQLKLEFSVENTSSLPVEFLWASHPMLAIDHLLRVDFPDGTHLDDFSPDGSERKWFIHTGAPVKMKYAGFNIELQTAQPWWGVWLDKGGWPVDRLGEVYCLGIEATNTAAEVPAGLILPSGGLFEGSLTLAWARN